MINNKSILITGGTGSFGKKFIQMTLEKYNPERLIIYSRDEMKQWDMAKEFEKENQYVFLGDVRDKDRLRRALDGVDFVIHGGVKIVPICRVQSI